MALPTAQELRAKARAVGGENMTPTDTLICGLLLTVVERLDELITMSKDKS